MFFSAYICVAISLVFLIAGSINMLTGLFSKRFDNLDYFIGSVVLYLLSLLTASVASALFKGQ